MVSKNKKQLKLAKVPSKLVTKVEGNSFIAEQFRTIRANINFSLPSEELKTLLITSAMPGEGKSTISANLAVVFAQEGKKVLLIDADMRKPTLHFTFKIPGLFGFSHILIGKYFYQNVVQDTTIEGLSVITSGPTPPNPAELLLTKKMEAFLESMKEIYDLVIFDAPPLLSVSDSQILANKCDATLFVVNAGVTRKDEFFRSEELLQTSKARVLGVILNNYKMHKKYSQNYYTY